MNDPTPEQMSQMIEAIFGRAEKLLAYHQLDRPADKTGFIELLRLTFDDDEAGAGIFASMDDELLDILWQLYQKRLLSEH